jgi:glutathione S-transferase
MSDDATYRLFYSPGACSLAPHIVLEEMGVAFEPVRTVIADGGNRTPEYLAMNPRGRVPTLIWREGARENVLTEAMAIMVWLSMRHPQVALLPAPRTESFVRALEWMSWLGSTMHQAGVRTVFRPERFTKDAASAPAIAEQGRDTIRSGYEDIERRLTGKHFALDEHFSAVDAYLLVFYRWGNRCGLAMREDFPHYARIMDEVRTRHAVRRVIEREGIQID